MKHHRLRALRTVVAGLATLLIVVAGPATSASAAPTYWTYQSKYNFACLTASADSTKVFTDTCQGWHAQDWDWVGPANSYGQHQLKSRTRGLCLTTDDKSDRNAIWLSSCGGKVGQYWDNDMPQVLFSAVAFGSNSLRISPGYSSVYSSDMVTDKDRHGIPYEAHYWWASAHS
ncbi:hypothetical protein GCM10010387_50380 [Streptomyces inusitatus]|uniref:Ricin B lectin domain-containing protein n=1 Tax=Streptomyces inusitatus TaxID=68221 RepID=A0A918V0R6_9ACTN|nr:RICIN domain-containing protein [Streptomyces inusitatus]GGZ49997.1 hypothetical protein GCM10010387_50380 [Streptomyces inusitatus]